MNILIYGSKGWIGSQFIELLKKHDLTYHLGIARVDDIASLQKEIKGDRTNAYGIFYWPNPWSNWREILFYH